MSCCLCSTCPEETEDLFCRVYNLLPSSSTWHSHKTKKETQLCKVQTLMPFFILGRNLNTWTGHHGVGTVSPMPYREVISSYCYSLFCFLLASFFYNSTSGPLSELISPISISEALLSRLQFSHFVSMACMLCTLICVLALDFIKMPFVSRQSRWLHMTVLSIGKHLKGYTCFHLQVPL